MAFPHPQGLLPNEVAFLCEMELITVIPRQRLERLDLLGGPTAPLNPPTRSPLPLWLALLLKRQNRCNIVPPPWLHPASLTDILELETIHYKDSFSPAPPDPVATTTRDRLLTPLTLHNPDTNTQFFPSPPFTGSMLPTASKTALPYHWFEVAELLLDQASGDLVEPDTVRGLLRDIREVRLAKMRRGVEVLGGEGEGVRLDGVGAMEVSESRGFVCGVVDGLRKVGISREVARREREEEEGGMGGDEEEEEQEEDERMEMT